VRRYPGPLVETLIFSSRIRSGERHFIIMQLVRRHSKNRLRTHFTWRQYLNYRRIQSVDSEDSTVQYSDLQGDSPTINKEEIKIG
jgi:hypothetical protein